MDRSKRGADETVTGREPTLPPDSSAPHPINPDTGQHDDHWVLSKEDRSGGFVRPVRFTYIHVGPVGPINPLRDLTAEEHERYDQFKYVKYEEYPLLPDSACIGKFWTQSDLDRVGAGCGTVTSMPLAIAETYAKNPKFYGKTFCCRCRSYFPVGKDGEFTWTDDGTRVGT